MSWLLVPWHSQSSISRFTIHFRGAVPTGTIKTASGRNCIEIPLYNQSELLILSTPSHSRQASAMFVLRGISGKTKPHRHREWEGYQTFSTIENWSELRVWFIRLGCYRRQEQCIVTQVAVSDKNWKRSHLPAYHKQWQPASCFGTVAFTPPVDRTWAHMIRAQDHLFKWMRRNSQTLPESSMCMFTLIEWTGLWGQVSSDLGRGP